MSDEFDVVVVGGGHAGVEAAHAVYRSGLSCALVSFSHKTIGQMSCNPAIGGLGKSHLVREVDAMGGIMAQATDLSGIQYRTLNTRKGNSVQALRVQCDRELYKKAIQLDENNYDAHLNLGNVYHIQNDYVNALTQFNTAILLNNKRAEAYFCRGNLQIDLGSTFGAVNDYTEAIKYNPNKMQYYMCRGFAYSNMGDFHDAIDDYSIAIQLNPESANSYYNMGKIQGMISDTMLACNKITEMKNKGNIRADMVYMSFCLI